MEFRYALTTLRIPVIVVVVGTGYTWERSEVRMAAYIMASVLLYPHIVYQGPVVQN